MDDVIRCPHCDHVFTDDDMLKAENDLYGICPAEDEVSEECPACGETVWIKGTYEPRYETFKTEDDLEDA